MEGNAVGNQLPSDVYDRGPNYNTAETYEDDETYRTGEADGWHGYVPDGCGYWVETDVLRAFWTCEDPLADLTPEETRELDETHMAYENKVRTFLQSRQLQRAKGTRREFFPLSMMKGVGCKSKSKGKGKKGKGFGGTMSSTPSSSSKPLFAARSTDGSTTSTSSGCFICGDSMESDNVQKKILRHHLLLAKEARKVPTGWNPRLPLR